MMLTVAVLGGSAFFGIEVAIETAGPALVAAARLWVGFAVMAAYSTARGQTLPRLGDRRAWAFAAAVGLIGYALPMSLFPWAQQQVTSGTAGVYMAFLPLLTLVLAALFAAEPLTPRRAAGFALGSAGVLVLSGLFAGEGTDEAAGGSLLAHGAILLAVLCYAAANVTMRRAPEVRPSAFGAAFLLCGAVLATPAALAGGAGGLSARSALAILALGLFPTGLTAVLILTVVRRAGAGFFALSAYAAPVIALGLGATFLEEPVGPSQLGGLALILAGLALAGGARLPVRRPAPGRAPGWANASPPRAFVL